MENTSRIAKIPILDIHLGWKVHKWFMLVTMLNSTQSTRYKWYTVDSQKIV